MKNLMENILLGTTKVKTNINFILTHAYDDNNKYRIIINSNYNYLTIIDIQKITDLILDYIGPITKLDYRNKFRWRLKIYTINSNTTKVKTLSQLINYNINIENLLIDYLSKNTIDIEPQSIETFFLIELINDNNKITFKSTKQINKLIPYNGDKKYYFI